MSLCFCIVPVGVSVFLLQYEAIQNPKSLFVLAVYVLVPEVVAIMSLCLYIIRSCLCAPLDSGLALLFVIYLWY